MSEWVRLTAWFVAALVSISVYFVLALHDVSFWKIVWLLVVVFVAQWRLFRVGQG